MAKQTRKLYPATINLLLPLGMKKQINEEAKKREIPKAQFIREAIKEKLGRDTTNMK